MAVLTTDQLAEMRQKCAVGQVVNYVKPQINAALQAIEDWFEATGRSGINAAINNATSPLVLTAAQKRRLVAYWLNSKFSREGV